MTEHDHLMKGIDLAFEAGKGNAHAFDETFGRHSHCIEPGSIRVGRFWVAACGRKVERADHSDTPSCPDCQQRLAEDEADRDSVLRLYLGDRA